ncbi:ParB/RepB/Spo0J family partition protein [Natranaerobius trueperi]|uniref:Chromosome partitioning protein ParB n=1 Tax=Natranaerobius trueperi TaxID=759412 RepID=A0A226BXI1_9FIRM|nr:ParB/RepB/Spo0J family partition protein [Natranaerobius trueperi]OWZ83482.1 chromosome partitioning protein ParB [Natranaerobius trueperi]
MNKKRLGKGLDALIPEIKNENEQPNNSKDEETISIESIEPNPHQPRKEFSEERLDELAQSIKTYGIIQPIIVTPERDKYRIVAGERRYRASIKAGLTEVPVIKKDFTDTQMMQIALLENIQREDLNPIDKGEALKKLVDEHGLTQNQLSQELGIGRSSLANLLRLLQLDKFVREKVKEGELSEGHARCLISLKAEDQKKVAKKILQQELSVRATENLVKQYTSNNKKSNNTKKDPFISDIEDRLSNKLGTKVTINKGKKKGKIEIEFLGNDDLEKFISILSD